MSLQAIGNIFSWSYSKGLENVLNKHFSTSSVIVIVLNIKRWDQISERIGVVSHYYDSKFIVLFIILNKDIC